MVIDRDYWHFRKRRLNRRQKINPGGAAAYKFPKFAVWQSDTYTVCHFHDFGKSTRVLAIWIEEKCAVDQESSGERARIN